MALLEFFRKKRVERGAPPYPVLSIEDLPPSARAFIEERKHSLDGWTSEELDEHIRRTLEGHEEELREAMREAEEHRKHRKLHD